MSAHNRVAMRNGRLILQQEVLLRVPAESEETLQENMKRLLQAFTSPLFRYCCSSRWLAQSELAKQTTAAVETSAKTLCAGLCDRAAGRS